MASLRGIFLAAITLTVGGIAAPIDFTLLNQVPSLRAVAYKRYHDGMLGDPQQRGEAEQKYLQDLTDIASKLRNTYYLRSGVPKGDEDLQVTDDMLKSIETLALLLENLKYPKNVAAGSELFYHRNVVYRRIALTEWVILRMSKAIVDESWDWERNNTPRTPFDYERWLASWHSAAEESATADPFR